MTASKKKERATAARKKRSENLDLDPWFWVTVAAILPAMAIASVADWWREWYDRTFIWGAVPDNRKKTEKKEGDSDGR